jgi:peptidyl-prolyl cis-trans isomerase B (cyclophilin B)
MTAKNRKSEVDAVLPTIDFAKTKYQIEFKTSMGPILLDLWPDLAPGHCKNLIALSKIGYYDGLSFHRIVKDFVIQGGCPVGTGTGGPGYTIKQEFNASPHDPGVLSMARTQDPNSAGSQFFLCLNKVPFLDRQYTAFGKTANDASLKVVLEIGSVKTGAQDRPVINVAIEKATVIETAL